MQSHNIKSRNGGHPLQARLGPGRHRVELVFELPENRLYDYFDRPVFSAAGTVCADGYTKQKSFGFERASSRAR